MSIISQDVVDQVWQDHAEKDFFEIEKDNARMSKEQPDIMNYLMTINAGSYNFEEQQMLLYMGVAVWKMMKKGGCAKNTVTMDDLDDANDDNIELIDDLEKKYPGDYAKVIVEIFNNYEQKHVLQHIRTIIMETDETKTHIRTENKGLMLFDLKAVVDCLK